MSKRFLLVFVLCVSFIFALSTEVGAETHIEDGYVRGTTVWSASSSPYIISDEIVVSRGSSLIIEAGVEIRGDSTLEYRPNIYVNGNMDIRGTKANPVSIENMYGIFFDKSTSSIAYADMETESGISALYSSLDISTSTVGGSANGLYIQGSRVNVTGSKIQNNEYGIYVQKMEPVFMVDSGHSKSLAFGGTLEQLNAILDKSDKVCDTLGGGNLNGGNLNSGNTKQSCKYIYEGNDLNSTDLIAQSVVPVVPSFVNITNSAIFGNHRVDLKSTEVSGNTVAINNWWGSVDGPEILNVDEENILANSTEPSENTRAKIFGNVDYSPWLDHDPTIENEDICCSNVLFIPGLQASSLHLDSHNMLGTSTNTLWVPNRNADVERLYLDQNGNSINPDIYSGNPIDSVFGVHDIYEDFMAMLDTLVSNGDIHEWQPFGYDWRKSVGEVVAGMEDKGNSSESIMDKAISLASTSKTGKITIVSHSNGGLVMKELVRTLKERGLENIIEKVIAVATPYLGTPQAISGLLHGDNQSIAGGIILKSATARELGRNMTSAYSLLPGVSYFERVLEPVIRFASSTIVNGINNGSYGFQINNFSKLFSFITDSINIRSNPEVKDVSRPIIGNSLLAGVGASIQNNLSDFSWPDNIDIWSVLGWNRETEKTLVYSERERCSNFLGFRWNCENILERSEDATMMGDGTVVAPSASGNIEYTNGNIISIDLGNVSTLEDQNIRHANILDSTTTQGVIKDIILGKDAPTIVNNIGTNIKTGEPDYSIEKNRLAIRLVNNTDNEVVMILKDNEGNQTGFTDINNTDSAFISYKEDIPNSRFVFTEMRDGIGDTKISVPRSGRYTGSVSSSGFGNVNIEVVNTQGSQIITEKAIEDIPVSPVSNITLEIITASTSDDVASSTGHEIDSNTLSTTTVSIRIDYDGDNIVDMIATSSLGADNDTVSGNVIKDKEYYLKRIGLLEKFIIKVLTPHLNTKGLLKRIDALKVKIVKSNDLPNKIELKMNKIGDRVTNRLKHKKLKDISNDDRKMYTEFLEELFQQ